MELSKYQADFLQQVKHGTNNIVLDAKAGSGKSTTMAVAISALQQPTTALVTAYSKKIVESFAVRAKKDNLNVDVRGVNSLGWETYRMNIERHLIDNEKMEPLEAKTIARTIRIDDKKYNRIVNELFESENPEIPEDISKEEYIGTVVKLSNFGRFYLTSNAGAIESLAVRVGIPTTGDESEYAARAIRLGAKQFGVVDYTDQLWLPMVFFSKPNLKYQWKINSYDWLFIDEAQDLSTLAREYMMKHLKPTGRFVAVGDPNQAIMGFAGANAQTFKQLSEKPNTIVMPLSVCYRVKNRRIADEARKVVPTLESPANYRRGAKLEPGRFGDVTAKDVIISRQTAPLISAAMAFLARSIPAKVIGREIGIQIQSFLKKHNKRVKPDSRDFAEAMKKSINADYSNCINRLKELGLTSEEAECSAAAIQIESMQDCILAILKENPNLSYGELHSTIDKLFSEEAQSGAIPLITAHRSKGLEWGTVYILEKELFQKPRPKQTKEQEEQEKNLWYVALTRAEHKINYLKLKDIPDPTQW